MAEIELVEKKSFSSEATFEEDNEELSKSKLNNIEEEENGK